MNRKRTNIWNIIIAAIIVIGILLTVGYFTFRTPNPAEFVDPKQFEGRSVLVLRIYKDGGAKILVDHNIIYISGNIFTISYFRDENNLTSKLYNTAPILLGTISISVLEDGFESVWITTTKPEPTSEDIAVENAWRQAYQYATDRSLPIWENTVAFYSINEEPPAIKCGYLKQISQLPWIYGDYIPPYCRGQEMGPEEFIYETTKLPFELLWYAGLMGDNPSTNLSCGENTVGVYKVNLESHTNYIGEWIMWANSLNLYMSTTPWCSISFIYTVKGSFIISRKEYANNNNIFLSFKLLMNPSSLGQILQHSLQGS
jgi:hypothetical protein